jgi:hypothetical protein
MADYYAWWTIEGVDELDAGRAENLCDGYLGLCPLTADKCQAASVRRSRGAPRGADWQAAVAGFTAWAAEAVRAPAPAVRGTTLVFTGAERGRLDAT